MNRAQIRAARRAAFRREAEQAAGRQLAREYAADYRCPDCLSEQELVEHSPGVMVLEVRHDETCPSYRAMGGR
jgi:hypothetical protein